MEGTDTDDQPVRYRPLGVTVDGLCVLEPIPDGENPHPTGYALISSRKVDHFEKDADGNFVAVSDDARISVEAIERHAG